VKSNRTLTASRSREIAALLIAGAWCIPALASNGLTNSSEEASDPVPTAAVEAASPILIDKIDSPSQEISDTDDAKAGSKPVEITQSSPKSIFEELKSDAEKPIEYSELRGIAPHLPGVSNVSLPRFRREMFRTDI
jgi:hypothetical protein